MNIAMVCGCAPSRQLREKAIIAPMSDTRVHPRHLADYLLERGERFVTTERCAELLRVKPENVSRSLAPARHANQMVSVTNRAWVPVPPTWRPMHGAPPVHDYLDDMMHHMGHSYYLGYRAASELHGASHHSFAHYHIVTPAPHRNRRIGRSFLCFVRGDPTRIPTVRKTVGYEVNTDVVVSTPEATVFDLIQRPVLSGGIDYVATLIGDLLVTNKLRIGALCDISRLYPLSITQRLGYIIEIIQGHLRWAIQSPLDVEPLAQIVSKRGTRSVKLSHTLHPEQAMTRHTNASQRWRVTLNHILNPEHKSRGRILA